MDRPILAVPTTIITGFLGVGKSSAIMHLLNNKPSNERWAVLVNEFGEVGIDGSVLESHSMQEPGIFIREVPGGCMCCTAGLPMQVALNQLLKASRPDRLLIEPTGLGHPKEIVHTLSTSSYRKVIALQSIVTLVDARKLFDTRYTKNTTFNEQIAIADHVVGNKQDLYKRTEKAALKEYLEQHGAPYVKLSFALNGNITLLNLDEKTKLMTEEHPHHYSGEKRPLISDATIPPTGYIKAVNQGDDFFSVGWRFLSSQLFSYEGLMLWLNHIKAERVKAVFITDQGIYSYNGTQDGLSIKKMDCCKESRIDIIHTVINEQWDEQLMACIIASADSAR